MEAKLRNIGTFGIDQNVSSQMNPNANDLSLIKDAIGGDMSAFKAIVERHEGKVAGVVKGMLGDTPEAADVGQEVFIKFYESLGKFKGDSTLSTYIIRIAINLSLNELKKRKRKTGMFVSLDGLENKGTDESVNELKERLYSEIQKLDGEFQEVVVLRIVEGYSVEETAAQLAIPIGTVMSRLYRAQKKLKQIITGHE